MSSAHLFLYASVRESLTLSASKNRFSDFSKCQTTKTQLFHATSVSGLKDQNAYLLGICGRIYGEKSELKTLEIPSGWWPAPDPTGLQKL